MIQNYTISARAIQFSRTEAYMRIGLIADIHSNIIALEAVLRDMKKHRPDLIMSLGDQINLGPCPRETLDLLKANDVLCLHGNHERYIVSAMDDHPGYRGANFNGLRFNAALLSREEITLPETHEIDGITFCHAIPGDDRFPVYDPKQAIPKLLEMQFNHPMHIICGHGHNPTNISLPNLTLQSIGSCGCMDDGVPGTAPYAILTTDRGCAALQPYYASYDIAHVKPKFIESGLAAACPIMAHIACIQMTTNTDVIVPFVARANSMSKTLGEEFITQATWEEADRTYNWPDGMRSVQFWK